MWKICQKDSIRLCGANFDEVTNILLLDPHEGNKVKPVKGTKRKDELHALI